MNAKPAFVAAIVALISSAFVAAHAHAAAGLAARPCAAGIVKIEYTVTSRNGNTRTQVTSSSLGTVVAPNVVLTHNHFFLKPGSGRGDTLTFVECAGKATQLPVDRLAFVAVDAGTALIYLPSDVSLASASVADQKTVAGVAAGARLTVKYWDEDSGCFAEKDFRVLKVKNGVATLADPDRVINPGDSGGGAFLGSALVANTWSIYTDAQGKAVGLFDVALLPTEVQRLLAEGVAGAAAGAQ